MRARVMTRVCAIAAIALLGCETPWTFKADCLEQPSTSSFGLSLALDGELALVGNENSADLYWRPLEGSPLPPHLWVHVQRFTPTRSAPPGLYGHSAALAGDLLAIGAPWGESTLTNNGYVDVYERVSAGWVLVQKVVPTSFDTPPGYGLELHFGTAVAIQGDELFVSARHWGDTAGRVFIFQRVDGLYEQTHELKPAEDIEETSFGDALSVSGNTLAIGRAGGGGSGSGGGSPLVPGEVHVYVKSGAAWTLQQVLLSPTPTIKDEFGQHLELHGDRLVVRDEAEVHMFERSGGVWAHLWARPVESEAGALPVGYQPATPTSPAYVFAAANDVVRVYVEGGTPSSPFNFQGTLGDPDQTTGFGARFARTQDRLLIGTGSNGQPQPRVRVFERELPERPTAVAVDDAQWALIAAQVERAAAADPRVRDSLRRGELPPGLIQTPRPTQLPRQPVRSPIDR